MAVKSVPTMLETIAKMKKNFVKEVKDKKVSFRERIKKAELFYCFLQECLSSNYVPSFDMWDIENWGTCTITVSNLKDFSTIHKIVGVLEQWGISPVKDDGRCRDVRVTMAPKDKNWNFLRFNFVRKLPKNAKCKIVKRVSVSHDVVCSR